MENEEMNKNRITSEQFINLVVETGGKMSQATLNRRLKDDDFIAEVGAAKEMTETSKIPAWTFDRKLSEQYAKEPDAHKKPVKQQSVALVRQENKSIVRAGAAQRFAQLEINKTDNVLLPHKILLTIDEARKLSGLPKNFLLQNKMKLAGKNYILREKLQDLVNNFISSYQEKKPKKKNKNAA